MGPSWSPFITRFHRGMVLQAQMAVLHILAVLMVLSAAVRLALYACSTMPNSCENERMLILRLSGAYK